MDYRKFARLVYAESRDEIPVKYNGVTNGRNMNMALDQYVCRFNPFKAEEMQILGEAGYLIRLPLLPADVTADPEKTAQVMRRTLAYLQDVNIQIAVLPDELGDMARREVRVADGRLLFPFFAMQAVQKTLKGLGKDIRDCEFAILNGNDDLTENIIDSLYGGINFMTVVTGNPPDRLLDQADAAFDETGLDIAFTANAKTVARMADVVFNASTTNDKLDYSFKRGCVYFDLCGRPEARATLALRRPDMLVIDGLRLSWRNEYMPLPFLELGLFIKSRDYRHLAAKAYHPGIAANVARLLEYLHITVSGFYQGDELLTTAKISSRKAHR